jgi:hypothetical protein
MRRQCIRPLLAGMVIKVGVAVVVVLLGLLADGWYDCAGKESDVEEARWKRANAALAEISS